MMPSSSQLCFAVTEPSQFRIMLKFISLFSLTQVRICSGLLRSIYSLIPQSDPFTKTGTPLMYK